LQCARSFSRNIDKYLWMKKLCGEVDEDTAHEVKSLLSNRCGPESNYIFAAATKNNM
jgi:hypothetical protein